MRDSENPRAFAFVSSSPGLALGKSVCHEVHPIERTLPLMCGTRPLTPSQHFNSRVFKARIGLPLAKCAGDSPCLSCPISGAPLVPTCPNAPCAHTQQTAALTLSCPLLPRSALFKSLTQSRPPGSASGVCPGDEADE